MELIEDYAFLGDTHSAALVSKSGSIDWMCLPRFDSDACFAAILDPQRGGHWRIAPASNDFTVEQTYRDESLVLETTFTTSEGRFRLTDCLPIEPGGDTPDPRLVHTHDVFVRVIECLEGVADVAMEFAPRFDYGGITPWVRSRGGGLEAVGGPSALDLQATVPMKRQGAVVSATFTVEAGQRVRFLARAHPSHRNPPELDVAADCDWLIERTDRFWREWAARCSYQG
jgi:GH15 family glucan-1,4-alpha-glucosidase